MLVPEQTWPVVIENAEIISSVLQSTLQSKRVCIAYHDDSSSPGASVLVDYVLEKIDLELSVAPGGQAYLLLHFISAEGSPYQLDIDVNSAPLFPSRLTITPGLIAITDYQHNQYYDDPDPVACGWTTITWLPEQAPTLSLADLITSARSREAQRESMRDLDLSNPADFTTYCVKTFSSRIVHGSAWACTLVPNAFYERQWTLELVLSDDGSTYLLYYAWHGPDMPCWHIYRNSDDHADIGLFYAACPDVMFDRLVLAIDELRTGAGPWPRVTGWSDEAALPANELASASVDAGRGQFICRQSR